ncbi:MAG: hypothetical protein KIS73_20445 [Enhydrobacter sp.]|nr:hypothetical protein [Enhydrobacter sp.]
MADRVASGKSQEEVALELARIISVQEGKSFDTPGSGADRTYILKTYRACLQAHVFEPKSVEQK